MLGGFDGYRYLGLTITLAPRITTRGGLATSLVSSLILSGVKPFDRVPRTESGKGLVEGQGVADPPSVGLALRGRLLAFAVNPCDRVGLDGFPRS